MSKRLSDNPQAWLNEETARIRARKDLSEAGIKDHLKQATFRAEAAAKKNRGAIEADRAERERRALRTVLGSGRSTYDEEYRSLRERALAFKTEKEAAAALEAAQLVGDHKEAKAIIAACVQKFMSNKGMPNANRWIELADRGAAEYPDIDAALTELGQLDRTTPGPIDFNNRISVPPELEKDNAWRTRPDIAGDPEHGDLTDEAARQATVKEAFFHAKNRDYGPQTMNYMR